jgi:16S rRNA (uracil1498-N3)-methyltransferase
MHRCHVEAGQWTAAGIRLSAEELHYLRDVLRVRDGEPVTVFDGCGREAEARVSLAESSGALKLTELRELPARAPKTAITLLQAIPKGARMDWIVEKATELGVSEIVPMLTERVVLRIAADQRREKAQRWQRIALSAARQCQTAIVPKVSDVTDLAGALALGRGADLFLVGALEPSARALKDALRARGAQRPARVALAIGPEGDFSAAELKAAVEAGAQPVSFGELVLRVETAALYGMSVLAYELS